MDGPTNHRSTGRAAMTRRGAVLRPGRRQGGASTTPAIWRPSEALRLRRPVDARQRPAGTHTTARHRDTTTRAVREVLCISG